MSLRTGRDMMARVGFLALLLVPLLAANVARAAELSVADLSIAPGATGMVVVSGDIAGESTFAVKILLELVPRVGVTGTVVFTPEPPVDIVQLGDPWPGAGVFSAFDTLSTLSPVLNSSVDESGQLPALLTFSGVLSGFPVEASIGASGVWDIMLTTAGGGSAWAGLPTTLITGVITICGDGFIDAPETCDDGFADACGSCDATCTGAGTGSTCGDSVVCPETETCDDGATDTCGDCNATCTGAGNGCLASLESFYAGRFADQADPSFGFLATGTAANVSEITRYVRGITGIRVFFDGIVTFATTPDAAFSFEWTTGKGATFTPVASPATTILVTAAPLAGATVVTILLNDDHVRARWLRVTIDAAQVTKGGSPIDGELTGNPIVMPSGNGTAGGNAVFFTGNLPGDVDGDRRTLLTDVGLVRLQVNPFLLVPISNAFDVDKDERVLLTDVGEARLNVNPFFLIPLITP